MPDFVNNSAWFMLAWNFYMGSQNLSVLPLVAQASVLEIRFMRPDRAGLQRTE